MSRIVLHLQARRKERLALKLSGTNDAELMEVLAMRDAAKGLLFYLRVDGINTSLTVCTDVSFEISWRCRPFEVRDEPSVRACIAECDAGTTPHFISWVLHTHADTDTCVAFVLNVQCAVPRPSRRGDVCLHGC